MIVFLVRKPTPVQAPGKDAIARISRQADAHLRQGRTLIGERKYLEAKSELDQALELDPANPEARRLRNLAVRAPEDEKLASQAMVKVGIGDRKALDEALRLLDETTEGTPAHTRVREQAGERAGQLRQLAVHAARVERLRLGAVPRVGAGAARGQARARRRRGRCATPSARFTTARTCAAARRPEPRELAFFDRFRVELAKYDEGVHDVGEPVDDERSLAARCRCSSATSTARGTARGCSPTPS